MTIFIETVNDFVKIQPEDVKEELSLYIGDINTTSEISQQIKLHMSTFIQNNTHLQKIYIDSVSLFEESKVSYAYLEGILNVINNSQVGILSIIGGDDNTGGFTDNDVALLAQLEVVLKENSHLNQLIFTRLELKGEKTAEIIGNILANPNCPLTLLSFSDVKIKHNQKWIEGFKKNTSLQSLDVYRVDGFSDSDAIALAKALETHTELALLNITCGNNTEAGNAIANALKKNQSLQYLGFGSSDFGEEVLINFAKALRENTRLAVLDLNVGFSYTDISSEYMHYSALAFAKTLKINQTLCYLNLRRSQLTMEGGRALLESLLKNNSLRYLSFSDDHNLAADLVNQILDVKEIQRMLWSLWWKSGFERGTIIYGDSLFAGWNVSQYSRLDGDMESVPLEAESIFSMLEEEDWEDEEYEEYEENETTESACEENNEEIENDKTAAISEDGYMHYIQWLPKEILEDIFELTLLEILNPKILNKCLTEMVELSSPSLPVPSCFLSEEEKEEEGKEKKDSGRIQASSSDLDNDDFNSRKRIREEDSAFLGNPWERRRRIQTEAEANTSPHARFSPG